MTRRPITSRHPSEPLTERDLATTRGGTTFRINWRTDRSTLMNTFIGSAPVDEDGDGWYDWKD